MNRAALRVVCLLACALTAGCNVLGAAAYVAGPPKVKARYVPAKAPLLVLAENYANSDAAALDCEQLERFVIEELKFHEIALPADHQSVYSFRLSDPTRFRAMSITEIGRLAGAPQVLYINLQHSSIEISPGSEMIRGRAAAQIRIVDTTSGATLWPIDVAGGYPVSYESPITRTDRYSTESDIRRAVQRALAERIVINFYSYKPD